MVSKLNDLQNLINLLAAMQALLDCIEEIIQIAGGMGGIVIPPVPDPLETHAQAQSWHDQMAANYAAWEMRGG